MTYSGTTASTACAASWAAASPTKRSQRVIPLAGDVGLDGLGLDDEGRELLVDLLDRRALRRHRQLRRPPRRGR